jgi:disulfide bond formation protein DsbB
MPSRRTINILGFLACAALLGYGYYLQYVEGLIPCPLCMLQRIAFYALGAVFLIAALHNPRGWGRRIYAVLILLAAGIGTALAARHVWLQSLPPDQVPTCGFETLQDMLDMLPLTDALITAETGSADCAAIDWQFLGLTIPGWALVMFVLLGLIGVLWNWLRR